MSPQVQNALWIAHPVLQLITAGVMFWRKFYRTFPVFFSYVVSQIVTFGIVFPFYYKDDYVKFFYAYWICAAISLALGFKVIHEIFLDIFRPYHTLKDLGSVLFKWAALVMLLVAGVVAAASPAGTQEPLVQAVIIVQRCVRVIQCGLILFLLIFSRYVGVSWRQHSFGIAAGFGGFAGVELAGVALASAGQIHPSTMNLLNLVAYNLAIMTWLGYVMFESPSRSAVALLTSQRWDQSLGDLTRPATGDSLIPMFEGMVDRAFSRTHNDGEVEEIASRTAASARMPEKVAARSAVGASSKR